MYQEERTKEILKILKNVHYATVDYLVEQIRYSPATIRRDLTFLEKKGLVKRSHGGVEINDENETPFVFRQHSMKAEKHRIAKAASRLVKNGDVIFLDGSSTAQYMGPYLTDKKDICVVTNNMMLASYLAENGVEAYCAGGKVRELPGTTAGNITAKVFASFHADIMFFSTDAVDSGGTITVKPEEHLAHNNAMLENSDRHVLLCGSNKLGKTSKFVQCSVADIDYFICDTVVDRMIHEKFPDTSFIYAED